SAGGKIRTREPEIVLFLCLLAAVHVFIFSATFPFFNNVDELEHFDLVVRYANGDIPRVMDAPCVEALPYIATYGAVEFLCPPAMLADKKIPTPTWKLPKDIATLKVSYIESFLEEKTKNFDVSQPPLYYALAGLWWRSAKTLGFHDGFLLYSVRFFNVFLVGTLVWLSYQTARLVFPQNIFVRLGVPAMLAFIPQTAFYSIQNDVLSPLCFGAAFFCLIQFMRAETPGMTLGIFTGLAMAATFLTKISNLPLLAVSAAAILLKVRQLALAGKFRAVFPTLATLALCAGLPAARWLVWCKDTFGDFTGNEQKIQYFGWTHKSFGEWWPHPIFTPHGFWYFFSGCISTFWQGEFVWNNVRLALPWVNMIYIIASTVLVTVALLNLLLYSNTTIALQRQVLWFGFCCFASTVAFLGFLSIIYNFHHCVYPSVEYPYFTSGRLMLGALIPFLLLFVYGLDCVLPPSLKFLVLTGIIIFMLITEITTDWPIFPNPYNWFHM
ncbi:MAG: hypothetical protein ABSG87_08195, partial [Verrucomicrobiota bacterium]